MAQGGVLGNGTRVGYSTDGSTWTRIGQLIELGFPSMTPDRIDNTVHSDTSNFGSTMPGLIRVGDMELQLEADLDEVTNPQFDDLWDHRDDGTLLYWRIEVPTNRARSRFKPFTFQGTVADFNIEPPIADKQMLTITVTPQGAISKAAATNSPLVS